MAVIAAVSLVALVGFVGLALDSGQLFVTKTELQNAADSCALSASAALTGVNANQLTIAENWGRTAGQANKVGFQSADVAVVPDQDVTFSETLNGAYLTKTAISPADALKMKFAKCTLPRSGIQTWFIQVLNLLPGVVIGDQTVNAMAVATLKPSQTTCALPVAICQKSPSAPYGFTKGQWLQGVLDPGEGITGDFKWVDYTPTAGGTNELKEILRGPGVCNLPATGTKVGEPGFKAGATAAWNTRFGLYQTGQDSPATAPPDFTGFAYTEVKSWPEKFNAYEGSSATGNANFKSARGAHSPYQGDSASGLKTKGTPSSAATHAAGADRRLGIIPVVDCDEFSGGSHEAAVKAWACILMLHPLNNGAGGGGKDMWIEYLGQSNDPASPCATLGLPGSNTSAGPMVPALVQ
ncbi:MAG TPA: pilus assembly protein TadG-related protein [Methylomirabilota bacterium]|nr:pilus assembly protein TadG-related protein [Methylomirabilota bacterium]